MGAEAKAELAEIFKSMGYASSNKIINLVQKVIWDELREEFIRCLTVDSETRDYRRKDFNEAIFDAERGYAVFVQTDLSMVLGKFDQAVRRMKGKP